MEGHDPKGAYVREVAESTRSFVHELQTENERLRELLLGSEVERQRLIADVRELQTKLEMRSATSIGLDREQLARLEQENHRFAERYSVLERQNSHLANLYVASYRLHDTLSYDEVLSVIQEIVINLIGCEQHAIFELSDDKKSLKLLAGMGIDRARCATLKVGDDEATRSVLDGVVFIAEGEPVLMGDHPHAMSAAIPLRLGGKTTGAIAVYQLLPQKERLEDIDRELFELLAVHAGVALYTTKIHQRFMS